MDITAFPRPEEEARRSTAHHRKEAGQQSDQSDESVFGSNRTSRLLNINRVEVETRERESLEELQRINYKNKWNLAKQYTAIQAQGSAAQLEDQ